MPRFPLKITVNCGQIVLYPWENKKVPEFGCYRFTIMTWTHTLPLFQFISIFARNNVMQWNKRKHCHEMSEGYASQLTFTCSKWTIQT